MPGYELSAKARADLKAIYVYTEERFGRRQAVEYAKGIEAKLLLIGERPEIGVYRPDIDEWTRSFPHKSHVIFYEARERGIFVLRILHAAQDPARHFPD